eukprot:gene14956-21012_t
MVHAISVAPSSEYMTHFLFLAMDQGVMVLAMDQDVCNVHNNYPRNNTRCCDTMVNKFKLWPAQNCGGALRSTSVQLLTDKKPIDVPVSLQSFSRNGIEMEWLLYNIKADHL